ncbi:MAG: hypothetical protein H7Y31_05780, partial [Chitinophagaceae bacterium]|nr:hypothetical protein [Chitinophagaceae bacterium]
MSPTSNRHIICKQSIELKFDGIDDSYAMHHRIAELFHERLEPALATLFDESVGTDETVTIDTLEIDCGIIGRKNWE